MSDEIRAENLDLPMNQSKITQKNVLGMVLAVQNLPKRIDYLHSRSSEDFNPLHAKVLESYFDKLIQSGTVILLADDNS